jgi:hypothetical protein
MHKGAAHVGRLLVRTNSTAADKRFFKHHKKAVRNFNPADGFSISPDFGYLRVFSSILNITITSSSHMRSTVTPARYIRGVTISINNPEPAERVKDPIIVIIPKIPPAMTPNPKIKLINFEVIKA